MDCKSIDRKVVIREGGIVSVSPNYLRISERLQQCYSLTKKIIQDGNKACLAWCEDNTISIGNVDALQLETSLSENQETAAIAKMKKALTLHILPSSTVIGNLLDNNNIHSQHIEHSCPANKSTPGKHS